jgi:Surface antigen
MAGHSIRLLAAAMICVGLAGCASSPDYDDDYRAGARAPRASAPQPRSSSGVLQCVPYARDHSGVKIWGDAYTWWGQADGKYARGFTPVEGAVMVLTNYAGPNRGHVAVVRDVVSSREIRIDHANWLDDGAIFTDDPVRDVSQANDWSVVRVFNPRAGAWGGRLYPVQGFIGPGRGTGVQPGDALVARAQDEASQSLSRTPPKRDAIATLLAEDEDVAAN